MLRQVLGDVARVQLGAAVDVGAVALHDDGELHCAESGPSSSPESSSRYRSVESLSSSRRRIGRGIAVRRRRRVCPARRSSGAPAAAMFSPASVRGRPGVRGAAAGVGARCSSHRAWLVGAGRRRCWLRLLSGRQRGAGCEQVTAPLRAGGWRRPVVLAAAVGGRSRLAGRSRARPVLNDVFERARAPLVEVHPARQRFEPHLQISILDADARQLEHEVVHELVVEDVDVVALLALLAEQWNCCS